MIITRNISVTISDFDGTPLAGAPIEIELKGLGNGVNGAVASGIVDDVTDENGYAVFKLWQNEGAYSETYYQITSYHPKGYKIHNREAFVVGGSDADVKDLIDVAPEKVNVTQALLDRVANDRAATAQALVDAQLARDEANSALAQAQTILDSVQAIADSIGQAQQNTAPAVSDISVDVVQGVSRIIRLGDILDSDGDSVAYSFGTAQNISVLGNMATFSSATIGSQQITITATDARGASSQFTLTVNVYSSAQFTEYSLANVQVA